jgi:Bacterial extracellular solute-binding protein
MKAHPNVTVKRTVVPYANLITKIPQDASAGDMPNLLLIDNPNVPEVAATGQLVPLNNLPGFTTSGYTSGAISECTYQGKPGTGGHGARHVPDVLPAEQAGGHPAVPQGRTAVPGVRAGDRELPARTIEYGANYPKVSQAIWTAIQAAITGTASESSALQTAQGTVSGVAKTSG